MKKLAPVPIIIAWIFWRGFHRCGDRFSCGSSASSGVVSDQRIPTQRMEIAARLVSRVARVMRPGERFSSCPSACSLSIRRTMSKKFHDTATKKVINVTPKRYRRPVSAVVLTSVYKVKSKNLRDTAASMSV